MIVFWYHPLLHMMIPESSKDDLKLYHLYDVKFEIEDFNYNIM